MEVTKSFSQSRNKQTQFVYFCNFQSRGNTTYTYIFKNQLMVFSRYTASGGNFQNIGMISMLEYQDEITKTHLQT